MGLPDKKPSTAVAATAVTAIGTLAVGAVLLQTMAFRVVGDVVSSAFIFGLGYGLCLIRNKYKG